MRGARHVADRGRLRSPSARRALRRHRVGRTFAGLAAAVVGLLVVTAGVTAVAVWRLHGNIRAVDVSDGLGPDRPRPADDVAGRSLNVLVMGSDSRDGSNDFIGGEVDEPRSDTTVVLHLSADRSRALAVSIPRDSMVDMPRCVDRDGGESLPDLRQFNDAFSIGGPACTLRTVEQLTGVRIDHYVVVDFAGFKDMVDALGSVPICLPHAVDDDRHNIHLPAGRTRVDGTQALAYVRARYALGDGGDLGRIGRQQAFIASVLQEVTSTGTLTNPSRLYGFLRAATGSVTMDPELARITRLSGLARQVAEIGLDRIQLVTVPTEVYPTDPNRLQWSPAASRLWRAVREDRPITFATGPAATGPAITRPTPTGSTTSGDVDPAQVRLRVLNATGTPGAAAAAGAELRDAGWNVVGIGDAETSGQQTTRIRHGTSPTALAHALALSVALPQAELVPDPDAGRTLRVEVGRDWDGLGRASVSGGPEIAGDVVVEGARSRTAATDICDE